MINIVTLTQIKSYSRIDDEDDTVLQMMLDSAVGFFESKGIKEAYLESLKDISTLNLGVLMLVDHRYNNRGITTEKALKSIPKGIDSIVFDLHLTCQIYLENNPEVVV